MCVINNFENDKKYFLNPKKKKEHFVSVTCLQRITSVTRKFASKEANIVYCPSKKPGAGRFFLNYCKPGELVQVIMFSLRGSTGLLESNGV